jgi:hypothetical protein
MQWRCCGYVRRGCRRCRWVRRVGEISRTGVER